MLFIFLVWSFDFSYCSRENKKIRLVIDATAVWFVNAKSKVVGLSYKEHIK